MRRTGLTGVFLLGWMVLLAPAWAHEGHGDGMGLDEVIEVGKLEINRLVDDKLLPASWKESAEFDYDKTDGLVQIKGKKRWVVAYANSAEPDPMKRAIRIVFTPMGKFVSYEFVNP